jgi:NAD(P)-dependent dehydrogenase (short-subunit alcohol dehydrogenase family)
VGIEIVARLLASKRSTATVEDFDLMMAINARSTFLCYKHAAKQMIAQGRAGRIIGPKVSRTSSWHVLMSKMFIQAHVQEQGKKV